TGRGAEQAHRGHANLSRSCPGLLSSLLPLLKPPSACANLARAMPAARPARAGRLFRPVHRWVWGDLDRRVRKLLVFGEVGTDGGAHRPPPPEGTPGPLP